MKTKEILEQLNSKYLSGGLITEIIEKLRQLEDMKRVMGELLDASTTIDELCCDLLDIADFQISDIKDGRKE